MEKYDEYDRPSVAADIAAFGIATENSENKRQGNVKKLKLLLIRRGAEPFSGKYALPGGFLRKNETIEQTAQRELTEETGVCTAKFISFGIYSAPDRDPRGWIISSGYLALLNTVALTTAENSDAAQALWFDFSYSDGSSKIITLTCGADRLEIISENGCISANELAFDHGRMIFDAFMKLRDEVLYHNIVFELLPELFPISDLQQIHESITGTKECAANFRRKMKDKITETEFFEETTAHRPSKLYRKN